MRRTHRTSSRRAELTSPIFMWLAIFISVMIVGAWFVRQIRPLQSESQTINFDLEQFKIMISNACSSSSYYKEYNPRTERGLFMLNDTSICIKTGDLCNRLSTFTARDEDGLVMDDALLRCLNSSGMRDCVVLPCDVSNVLTEDLSNITFVYAVKEGAISFYSDNTIGDVKTRFMG